MKNTRLAPGNSRKQIYRVAAVLLLVASTAGLVGCVGVSAGGTGQQTSTLSLASASLTFGNVTAGSSKTLTVLATNSGPVSVTVSSATVSTKYFSLAGPVLPITIAAGQSESLSVAFNPNSSGAFSAVVTITSDASDATTNLSVSGTGVADGQLAPNPSSEAFGSVTVGSQQTLSATITNTGGTTVTISQAGISGAGLSLSGIASGTALTAGQSATFSVTFAPASAGAVSGNITVTSNATNPTLTIPVSGTGVSSGALGSNPTSLAFGTVAVGGTQTLAETVTNTGGTTVTISQAGITGTGFSLNGISSGVTLTAGQSLGFSVSFAPQSAGAVNGNVTITSNATNPTLTVAVSGTGSATPGQLSVTPSTLATGSVVVGTSGTASGTLTASGANVTVGAASANNSAFSVGGLPLPVTIPAGQSTSFSVTFSPQTTGAASATLTFTSNAQPSASTETLTGTGTPAPVHSVNLSWNASTSSNVSGYNVYRATYVNSACGSFAKINSVLNTGTLYTDNVVVDGTSYCYETTAVDTSNQESGPSNIVSNVQIPAP